MQMVHSKKIGIGLVLIAGLFGMCVSNAAFALPEMEVGSRSLVGPNVVAPVQTVDSDAATTAEEEYDSVDAQPASN
jgi:hypothetical protein